jgi:hypothetical protein
VSSIPDGLNFSGTLANDDSSGSPRHGLEYLCGWSSLHGTGVEARAEFYASVADTDGLPELRHKIPVVVVPVPGNTAVNRLVADLRSAAKDGSGNELRESAVSHMRTVDYPGNDTGNAFFSHPPRSAFARFFVNECGRSQARTQAGWRSDSEYEYYGPVGTLLCAGGDAGRCLPASFLTHMLH